MFVAAAAVNSCIGNVLLKQSRLKAQDGSLLTLLLSPWFMGGLFFYGINVVLFAKALDKLPVSIAYPVLAAGGFAILSIASALIFKEALTTVQWLGLGITIFGIFLLARS